MWSARPEPRSRARSGRKRRRRRRASGRGRGAAGKHKRRGKEDHERTRPQVENGGAHKGRSAAYGREDREARQHGNKRHRNRRVSAREPVEREAGRKGARSQKEPRPGAEVDLTGSMHAREGDIERREDARHGGNDGRKDGQGAGRRDVAGGRGLQGLRDCGAGGYRRKPATLIPTTTDSAIATEPAPARSATYSSKRYSTPRNAR